MRTICWTAVFTFFQDRHTNKPTQAAGISQSKTLNQAFGYQIHPKAERRARCGGCRPQCFAFANTTQKVRLDFGKPLAPALSGSQSHHFSEGYIRNHPRPANLKGSAGWELAIHLACSQLREKGAKHWSRRMMAAKPSTDESA